MKDPFEPAIGRWAAVVLREDEAQAKDSLAPLLRLRQQEGIAFEASGQAPGDRPAGLVAIERPPASTPALWEEALREVTGRPPHHLLLVGGPDRFPFEVVRKWSSERIVGLLDAADDPLGALSWRAVRRYAEKVTRYATGQSRVDRKALVYAFKKDKATRRSFDQLATPFLDYVKTGIQRLVPSVQAPLSLLGGDATTGRLCEALRDGRPALVLTCSHGIEYPPEPRLWGALTDVEYSATDGLPLSVDRVKHGVPFAPGAVFFAFACFSAGIPEESAIVQLIARRDGPPEVPRLAPLPRLLLGHDEGPLAFVGHLDRATVGSFAGFDGPRAFEDFADWTLGGFGTVGQAMSTFWSQASAASADLLEALDARHPSTPQQIVNAWIRHHDATGWLLLGDPCVRLASTAP
ncbi:hypothetical protein WME75_41980 [Sorangium sp. So ce1014]|uniref:hypothetical protein n=1 Tax=Sorangium sp. So ce1014 TaxID=3133326 RepID=UPI003F611F08